MVFFIARLTGQPSSHAPAELCLFRRLRCLDGRSKRLYALYASKNRLCMLCENTTPELTAYNAYRNENRRVRRAEGMKMYAVGDAYKCIQVHTSEHKRIRRVKEGNSSFYFFFILSVLLSSTARDFRHSSFTVRVFRHVRTPPKLIARSFRLAGRMRVPRDAYRCLQTV